MNIRRLVRRANFSLVSALDDPCVKDSCKSSTSGYELRAAEAIGLVLQLMMAGIEKRAFASMNDAQRLAELNLDDMTTASLQDIGRRNGETL